MNCNQAALLLLNHKKSEMEKVKKIEKLKIIKYRL